MTYQIEQLDIRLQKITLDFADELNGESLEASRKISGTREQAEAYIPVFANDIRNSYNDRFPMKTETIPEEITE